MALVKTTLRLDEKTKARGEKVAAKQGLPFAEYVRQLLDSNLKGVRA